MKLIFSIILGILYYFIFLDPQDPVGASCAKCKKELPRGKRSKLVKYYKEYDTEQA